MPKRTADRETAPRNARSRQTASNSGLWETARDILRDTEGRLGHPLLAYWTSVNGALCMNDVLAMNEILKTMPRGERLSLFIKTDGGTGRAALRMVNLLRSAFPKLTALLPANCESAGTMLALGADEIHMGPMAFLTPVDTSITHDLSPVDKDNDLVRVGTNEIQRILGLWRHEAVPAGGNPFEEIYKYVHPLVIGAVDRAGSLSTMLCDEILFYHVTDKALREQISHRLNNDYPSHGYPIVLREARRIGLNALPLDPAAESGLNRLNNVFSELGQKHRTDYDELNHHDNEIVNIVASSDIQIYFEIDKEWHFRQSDRTWVYTNEQSNWKVRRGSGQTVVEETLHFR